ncbi:hypothetical protein ONS95_014057 [Cadophora gregata]|uniref:uncharacterized protein n=1 Tax=Cadophora gregata TaxID=51156 RepID=UPI0026DC61E1|nr:uncharacterized protein ONS95_014057 [Cadophora gregata]KAK0113809.1 hypothetical protein ONS96_014663 [Cadophora gregata f. sp. sojae]KAK0114569.1 hypothetical protein ONS95_014057 [Cadophora gregata]
MQLNTLLYAALLPSVVFGCKPWRYIQSEGCCFKNVAVCTRWMGTYAGCNSNTPPPLCSDKVLAKCAADCCRTDGKPNQNGGIYGDKCG